MLQNRNVLKVSETTITYCPHFKVQDVRANLNERKSPHAILIDAGFELDLIAVDPAAVLEEMASGLQGT